MAAQEHLDLLEQGPVAWNAWRRSNAGTVIDLRDANLRRRIFFGYDFTFAILHGADLSYASLGEMNIGSVEGAGVSFEHAFIHRCRFQQSALTDAKFRNATFAASSVLSCDMRNSSFQAAKIEECMFTRVRLTQSNLRDARLGHVQFQRVSFTGADFSFASFDGVTLTASRMAKTQGLETVSHRSPSSVGLDTFFTSEGMPASFLRGVGAPDVFINHAEGLIGANQMMNSCFISYSSHDDVFARQLHNDLQARGVRCWFAPHDLPIGGSLRSEIDSSIQTHDKLLLILSRDSIDSNWVEAEVEKALERESREDRSILMPIRIDDSVFQSDRAWAAHIRRTRQIGDFCDFASPPAYQLSLLRLLRDLHRGQPASSA